MFAVLLAPSTTVPLVLSKANVIINVVCSALNSNTFPALSSTFTFILYFVPCANPPKVYVLFVVNAV